MRVLAKAILFTMALVAPVAQAAGPADVGQFSVKCAAFYASAFGVPVELVDAVIQVESGWNPHAVSNKGAAGLMQLMPATALRFGVRKALVDKLTNTRFEPSGFTENPSIRYASSVLDYIARWLGGKFLSAEYLKPRIDLHEEPVSRRAVVADASSAQTRIPSSEVGDAPSCSTCGMLMVPNGSCYKCANCGSTSGCS